MGERNESILFKHFDMVSSPQQVKLEKLRVQCILCTWTLERRKKLDKAKETYLSWTWPRHDAGWELILVAIHSNTLLNLEGWTMSIAQVWSSTWGAKASTSCERICCCVLWGWWQRKVEREEKSRFSGIGAPHFDASCARPHFQLLETLSTKEIWPPKSVWRYQSQDRNLGLSRIKLAKLCFLLAVRFGLLSCARNGAFSQSKITKLVSESGAILLITSCKYCQLLSSCRQREESLVKNRVILHTIREQFLDSLWTRGCAMTTRLPYNKKPYPLVRTVCRGLEKCHISLTTIKNRGLLYWTIDYKHNVDMDAQRHRRTDCS